MNNRVNPRPHTAGEMASEVTTYPMLTNTWKHDLTRNNSAAGLLSSKYRANNWSANFGPDSGGFLPILDVKQRSDVPKKPAGKTKDTVLQTAPIKNSSQEFLKSGMTHTATIVDLAAIMPPVGNYKMQRQNTMPALLGSLPSAIKHADDTQSDFVLSRLAFFEKFSNMADNIDRMTANLLAETENVRASIQSNSLNAIENKRTLQTQTTTKPPSDVSRWKLSISVPKSENDSPASHPVTSETDRVPLKSILKPKVCGNEKVVQTYLTPQIRHSITTVYNLPIPEPKKSIEPAKPKNRSRRRATVTNSSLDSKPDSRSGSVSSNSESIENHENQSKSTENNKSVRFSENPAQIKEYLPWEAPSISLQNHCL